MHSVKILFAECPPLGILAVSSSDYCVNESILTYICVSSLCDLAQWCHIRYDHQFGGWQYLWSKRTSRTRVQIFAATIPTPTHTHRGWFFMKQEGMWSSFLMFASFDSFKLNAPQFVPNTVNSLNMRQTLNAQHIQAFSSWNLQ